MRQRLETTFLHPFEFSLRTPAKRSFTEWNKVWIIAPLTRNRLSITLFPFCGSQEVFGTTCWPSQNSRWIKECELTRKLRDTKQRLSYQRMYLKTVAFQAERRASTSTSTSRLLRVAEPAYCLSSLINNNLSYSTMRLV